MRHLIYLSTALITLTSCMTYKNASPSTPEQVGTKIVDTTVKAQSETPSATTPSTTPIVTEQVQIEEAQQEENLVQEVIEIQPSSPKRESAITEQTTTTSPPAVTTQAEVSKPPVVLEAATTVDHSKFDKILATHVSASGKVNYAAIVKNWSSLRAYIKLLGSQTPEDSWSKNEKLAYWMNAYNAMTIDLILRNYPLESIKDIKDPWDQRLWKLGDKWYNLNEIEHQILRKMGDPRIHFGINCASFSCPPLLNKAFTATNVDKLLNQVATSFINDAKRNMITSDRVEVSKIFNWFGKDFKTEGSLIDYLNKYSEIKIIEGAKVRYMDYDWSLNL